MTKNLLIVESPAKAKTIEKYLGKNFFVKSSYGHIRDLSKEKMGVEIDNNFLPNYVISKDKSKVVKELKESVKKATEVWLATDEDREGEAISWHLCKVLGLDENSTKRIVFREITKPALESAINNPRTVDINLVNAQQARRVLDRLVGFELSGLLWKKVKGKLSAGRVQSVAVKLIVDRERAINKFEPEIFYKVIALFNVENRAGKMVELKADLKERFKSQKEATDFLNNCIGGTFSINNIQVKPLKRNPAPPFTTSTLQQEASRKLGFSVKRTMSNAQRLYEQGHISYMRTDSVNLSETSRAAIGKTIVGNYGENYLHPRTFKGKSQNAQEAHEAIRPTDPAKFNVTQDRDQQRLYELIWKRTVATQMAQAQLEKTTVSIGVSTIDTANFVAIGEVLKFDGFLKVYMESIDDEDTEGEAKGILPPLSVGQKLQEKVVTATERFTKASPRYSEASLVKKMEELGIGRPSTYAPTISKITEETRGYITKESKEGVEREYNVINLIDGVVETSKATEKTGAEKSKLFPNDIGILVSDFLSDNFENIMDYKFTAEIEAEFDQIAEGKVKWEEMLERFYSPFHDTVEQTLETAERVTGERKLGKDPETGLTLLVRMSRFGPVAQIGASDELKEDEKPKYANLKPGMSLEHVTYEEAIELFKLPRELGAYENHPVTIGAGRWGPYIKYNEKFISIPRTQDPLEITKEEAIELIEEKKRADAPFGQFEGHDMVRGKGRFGPFIKWNGIFINIPRKYDPENLSIDDAYELIKIKKEKLANQYIHRWDDLKLSVQNGRWGPFIKYLKKNVKLPKTKEGNRMTSEEAKELDLETVKKLVLVEYPDAFKAKKKKAAAKKKKKAPAKKKKAPAKKK